MTQIAPVLLGGLGLYITLTSLPGAVSTLGNVLLTWDLSRGIGMISAFGLSEVFVFISRLLVLGLGLSLVVNPARISRVLTRLWDPYRVN